MRQYVDANILIWHLRGEKKAGDLLRRLSREEGHELWTGAPQRAEIVLYMKPEEETDTLAALANLKTQPLTQTLVDRAGVLFRRWHPTHGMDANDAFLAAMALETGGRIVTLNMKRFPDPGLNVLKGW
jgi:predicted nucleic acid-binding protein